jgi:hypothetical protein
MAIVWVIPGIPIIVGLWLMIGWWTLIPVAVAAWATWDYIRKGGSGIDQFKYGF